jgi:hypothetical protein
MVRNVEGVEGIVVSRTFAFGAFAKSAVSSAPTGALLWNLVFEYFSKICLENSNFIKIWPEQRVLYMKISIRFWSYLAHFLLLWEMWHTQVVEKIKTSIWCSLTFFPKIVQLWGNVEQFYRAGQQYGACALIAGYLMLRTHPQNM